MTQNNTLREMGILLLFSWLNQEKTAFRRCRKPAWRRFVDEQGVVSMDFEDAFDFEDENEYLTPIEVRQLLYIGRNTFYKLVNSGQLPAFRVGKLWRVRKADLEAYCRRLGGK